jgi:hypothetical protein
MKKETVFFWFLVIGAMGVYRAIEHLDLFSGLASAFLLYYSFVELNGGIRK